MYQLQIGSGPLKTPWVQFGFVKNRTEIHQDPSWVPLGVALLLKPQEAEEKPREVEVLGSVQLSGAQSPLLRASSSLAADTSAQIWTRFGLTFGLSWSAPMPS